MEIKSAKMVKSLFLFFQSYKKCFRSKVFFRFGQILFNLNRKFAAHHGRFAEALFLPFLRSLLITYLITLSLDKEIIVFEKSLEFWKKKTVRTLKVV